VDVDRSGAAPVAVSPLAGLVTVDSREDPRVQVADLLAGIVRTFPDDGPGEETLERLVSPHSLRDTER
jgi:hypothetical protein